MKGTGAILLAAAVGWGGWAHAADATDDDLKRLADDAKQAGRDYAKEGERIADEATDFAKQVADDFSNAYEKAKEDAKKDE